MSGGVSFYIGTREPGIERFDGFIDEVRVYDHELGAADAAMLFNGGC